MRRRRNQRGATAVFVAILAVMLIGLTSFTLDFGQAYVSKRQLQTGADAAALAAAAVYASHQGSCDDLKALSTTAAQAAADDVLAQNRIGATPGTLDVDCSPDGKSLDVSIDATATTPVTLGAVYGVKQLTTQRSATARLSVPNGSVGLKPYLICNFYVPDPLSAATVTTVPYPTNADSTGVCPHPSGNWFTLDCPHAGNSNNGNPGLADATLNGCDHEVSVVSSQNTTGSKHDLYTSLVAACPSTASLMTDYDPDCLTANPGNLGSGNINDPTSIDGAWQAIVGTKGLFPVFCGTDKCDPVGYVPASPGNNAMYPVYKLVGAEICGWHWGSKNSGVYPTVSGDPCSGANPTTGTSTNNYLLMAFTLVVTSGGTDDLPECALGDASCDGLARTFYLAK